MSYPPERHVFLNDVERVMVAGVPIKSTCIRRRYVLDQVRKNDRCQIRF